MRSTYRYRRRGVRSASEPAANVGRALAGSRPPGRLGSAVGRACLEAGRRLESRPICAIYALFFLGQVRSHAVDFFEVDMNALAIIRLRLRDFEARGDHPVHALMRSDAVLDS